ncbi:MAG: hypothetical protein RLZZ597_2577 [Cyanobacteriota bacterium]|jgi:hypothetical protein
MVKVSIKQRIIQKLEHMEPDTLALLDSLIDRLATYRQSSSITIAEPPTDEAERQILVRSLRGMAAKSTLSSDDFSQRKQADIDWENRNL